MYEFKSWTSYFDFEHSVKHKTRFIHEREVIKFLDTVLKTGEKRKELIGPEGILYRAQLGCDVQEFKQDEEIFDTPIPYSKERMKPFVDKATEGRANPNGIPYLYLSTNKETALAEVRPWIESKISLGTFSPTRELSIINCTINDGRNHLYLQEPSADKREDSVWYSIDKAFANPVSRCDDVSDYAPTQIIAELFKSNGYDGFAYRSSLGDGHNIVLFDLSSVKVAELYLHELKSLTFEFRLIHNEFTQA